MDTINKNDLKRVIMNIMNDTYIERKEICELIEKHRWMQETNYKIKYNAIFKDLINLVGKKNYELYRVGITIEGVNLDENKK